MKKIITPLFVIFFAVFTSFGQSVTLTPSMSNQNSNVLFGAGGSPNYSGFRGGATTSSPVNGNSALVSIRGFGYNGTSFSTDPNGAITITAAENFTPTANGTIIRFFTTQIGTTGISTEKMRISDVGNLGIGTSTPGFPLNFANTIGDKISLWGQTGNHFGLGIDNSLMMIHTDLVGSDIAFGHGAFGAFTETIRIKGNGNLGIGTNDPQAKLHVNGTSILSTTPGTGEQVLIGESASGDSKVSIKSNGYTYALKVEGSGSTAVGLAVLGGASIEGNSQFGNDLTVLQAFTSQGSATFEGASNFNNNATFNAPAAFNQNVSIQNLSVNNITPTASAVNIQGNLSTTNNSDVNGFSKLGSDSPAIKVKKLTGTTAGTQLGTATITHGLTRSKILSCSVLVDNGTYSTPPNSTFTNVRYTFDIDDVNIVIYNSSTTDAQQHNKPIVILVTYEQ